MRICGVELTANDAVISLIELVGEHFTLPDCRARKLSLPKEHTREDLHRFQFAFAKLMSDYKVDKVAIKERMTKGKFAGGSVSFKLESAIQLIADLDVITLSSAQVKTALSDNPLPITFSDTELKGFQEGAFIAAYVAHMLN
jgi:Protein of unknown function (DUF3010)